MTCPSNCTSPVHEAAVALGDARREWIDALPDGEMSRLRGIMDEKQDAYDAAKKAAEPGLRETLIEIAKERATDAPAWATDLIDRLMPIIEDHYSEKET